MISCFSRDSSPSSTSRRKFGDDPVYKFAMRSYLAYIVEKRFNLEWYIEGGRSRSGRPSWTRAMPG